MPRIKNTPVMPAAVAKPVASSAAKSVAPTKPSASVDPTVTAQVVNVEAPVATVVSDPQQSTDVNVDDGKSKQVRQQLAGVIDVTVSTARTRNMLTDMGVNAEVRSAIDEISNSSDFNTLSEKTVKYILNTYADVTKPDDAVTAVCDALKSSDAEARSKLNVESSKKAITNLLSRSLIRAGDDSVCALAATANWIITQLAKHGVKTLISESKKTLKPRHIVNDEITNLKVWPFLRTLPCVNAERESYKNYLNDVERKKSEKKEKDKAKKAAAKAAAESGVDATKSADTKVDETKHDKQDDTYVSDDDENDVGKKKRDPSDCFKHHAYNIARDIVNREINGDVSNDIRRFGSNVIYELIKRYVNLIRLQLEYAGVKTIKANTIITINKLILTDAGVDDPEFEEYIRDRVDKYGKYSAVAKNSVVDKKTV